MIELVLLALLAADIYIKWIAYPKDTHNIFSASDKKADQNIEFLS